MRFVTQALDATRMAIAQLWSQRLKSLCMMAGVAVAVGFLMALVSILAGTRAKIEASLAHYAGANVFRITSQREVTTFAEAMAQRAEHPPPLTEADANGIAATLPSGARWSVSRMGRVSMASRLAPQPRLTYMQAVGGAYFDIESSLLARGRVPTPQELALGARVIVLWSSAAPAEFPGVDPLGRTVTVSGVPYEVVGVLAPDETERWRGRGPDGQPMLGAIIPLHSPAARATGRGGEVRAIRVQVARAGDLDGAEARVREVMRVRHRLGPRAADDFGISTGQEYIALIEKESRQFIIASIVLPSVGLVVGAIVIANIMLVAIAERTREIGIRKAIGARRADVLRQFLVEAMTLSIGGAAVGIVLGLAVPAGVAYVNPGFPAAVAPWSIALGLVLGLLVGVVSGVYPAMRAARLDPIHALRHDM